MRLSPDSRKEAGQGAREYRRKLTMTLLKRSGEGNRRLPYGRCQHLERVRGLIRVAAGA